MKKARKIYPFEKVLHCKVYIIVEKYPKKLMFETLFLRVFKILGIKVKLLNKITQKVFLDGLHVF